MLSYGARAVEVSSWERKVKDCEQMAGAQAGAARLIAHGVLVFWWFFEVFFGFGG